MIFFKKYYFDTTRDIDCIVVTHEVNYAIRDAEVESGLAVIVVPNPGAGVIIGEDVPDIIAGLKEVVTQWGNETSEARAIGARNTEIAVCPRIQSALMGRILSLPFDNGKICVDSYSDVLLWDFVIKPQRRELLIQIMGEGASDAGGQPSKQMG